jgi:hypothetical protein
MKKLIPAYQCWSSRYWRHVDWQVDTNVVEEHTAFSFTAVGTSILGNINFISIPFIKSVKKIILYQFLVFCVYVCVCVCVCVCARVFMCVCVQVCALLYPNMARDCAPSYRGCWHAGAVDP